MFARTLAHDNAIEYALVVCGAEHLDEIPIAGETHVWEVKRARARRRLIPVSTWSRVRRRRQRSQISRVHLSAVEGGSPDDNSAYLIALLSIHPTPELVQPICEYLLLNSTALLVVSGFAEGGKKGVQKVWESIDEMWVWHALTDLKKKKKVVGGPRL